MNKLYLHRFNTPLGEMVAAATSKELYMLLFSDMDSFSITVKRIAHIHNLEIETSSNTVINRLMEQLNQYFEGIRKDFDIPLAYSGSPFQLNVWHALKSIPYGQTITYHQLSVRLGDKNAIRAAAKANGANCLLIVVPCHRVIGKDGKLTGYAGGINRKQTLLELESAVTKALL